MTEVKDIMTKDVITFSPNDSIYDCAKILRESRISGAPVMHDEKVVGVLSEADIMELIKSKDISINTILPSPLDVLELPVRMKLGLDEITRSIEKTASARVSDIMTGPAVTISPEEDTSKAARTMTDRHINRLPVLDEAGKLVGIVTRGDVIGAM